MNIVPVTQFIIEEMNPTSLSIEVDLILSTLHSINYVPSLLEILKNVWLVYFSLLVPTNMIINQLKAGVFRNRLFNTRQRYRIGDYVINND